MSGDFVSRDYLLDEYDRQHQGPPGGARKIIAEAPAADVVPVVRCYECKYWEHRPDRQYDLCAYLFGAKRSCNPEDFCSRGERKGGQEEIPAGPYDLLYEEGGPDA